MVQRHVHIHGSRFTHGLRSAHHGEQKIPRIPLVVLLQQILAEPAVLGDLRQQFLVIERNLQLLRQQARHIPSSGAILTSYGNDCVGSHANPSL